MRCLCTLIAHISVYVIGVRRRTRTHFRNTSTLALKDWPSEMPRFLRDRVSGLVSLSVTVLASYKSKHGCLSVLSRDSRLHKGQESGWVTSVHGRVYFSSINHYEMTKLRTNTHLCPTKPALPVFIIYITW